MSHELRTPLNVIVDNLMLVIEADMIRAQRAGFDRLLGKPLKVKRFQDQIRRILAGEAVWEPY
jgi:signal transduction histidine kinase